MKHYYYSISHLGISVQSVFNNVRQREEILSIAITDFYVVVSFSRPINFECTENLFVIINYKFLFDKLFRAAQVLRFNRCFAQTLDIIQLLRFS